MRGMRPRRETAAAHTTRTRYPKGLPSFRSTRMRIAGAGTATPNSGQYHPCGGSIRPAHQSTASTPNGSMTTTSPPARAAGPPRVAYADAAGTPLGHPLGGYGHEHRVEARAWPADARWRLRAAFAAIEREPGNLLYERKPGAGWSAAFGAAYRLGARVELEAAGQVERGRTGWREHRASVRLAAFF